MSLSSAAPWTAFYGSTPASLTYPDKTMYTMVADTAAEYPDHTAYIFMGKSTSYAAFLRRIDTAARGLLALGIENCLFGTDSPWCDQIHALELLHDLKLGSYAEEMIHAGNACKLLGK